MDMNSPSARSSRQSNMRAAVGTLVAAAICMVITFALWVLPFVLSNGGDPNESGWIVLVLWSIFPGGLAAVLFLVSLLFFVIALTDRRPQ
jgi:hypothetical protein